MKAESPAALFSQISSSPTLKSGSARLSIPALQKRRALLRDAVEEVALRKYGVRITGLVYSGASPFVVPHESGLSNEELFAKTLQAFKDIHPDVDESSYLNMVIFEKPNYRTGYGHCLFQGDDIFLFYGNGKELAFMGAPVSLEELDRYLTEWTLANEPE